MKFCPSAQCLTMQRHGRPAEFLDHATVCNDCGIGLVGEGALGAPETLQAVASFHEARGREAARAEDEPGRRPGGVPPNVDIATGIALIVLSIVLLYGSMVVASSMGGGRFFIALGPLGYGVIRLMRGLEHRKTAKSDV